MTTLMMYFQRNVSPPLRPVAMLGVGRVSESSLNDIAVAF